jgi:4-amino-4-deoxy-L-arabinose transferase-like glycosyltransferase
MGDPRGLLPLLVVAGSAMLLGLVSLAYPFGRDQGTYAFYAEAMLRGMSLYRDVPMMQMPLTAFVHLIALVLFGHSMTAIRILDLFWTAGIALLTYLFVRQMFRRNGLALLVGLLFPFIYYLFDWWGTAQVDGFLNLPAAGAFALAAVALNRPAGAPASGERPHWFLAGLLVTMALLFKYTVILMLPAVFVGPLLTYGWRSTRTRSALVWLSAGFAAGTACFLTVVTATGVLPGLIETQVRATAPYAALGLTQRMWLLGAVRGLFYGFTNAYPHGVILVALGLVPAAVTLLRRGPEAEGRAKVAIYATLAWLAAGMASVFVQRKFFPYHYLAILPALAVLGGMALVWVLEPLWRILDRRWQRTVLVAVGVIAALVGTEYFNGYLTLGRAAFGVQSIKEYWVARHMRMGDYIVAEQLALADYLARNTRQDERVVNYGIDPCVTFPAWRKPQFRYTSPFLAPNCTLTTRFREDPPEVFLVKHDDRLPWVYGHSRDSYEQLLRFGQLRDYILANYELEARIGKFDVLRLVVAGKSMPDVTNGPEQLAADLQEAETYVPEAALQACSLLLWPVAPLPALFGVAPKKALAYRDFNRSLWANNRKTPADFLPMLSVWIKDDERPFAKLDPFCLQNDGKDFATDEYRFGLLHTCRNGLVFVYQVDRRTGREVVSGDGE